MEQFYHETIRRTLVVFGSLFDDIYISRKNSTGAVVQTLHVPIAYGPKHSFLVRQRQDPDLDREIAISLPRLAFQMIDLQYDASRKLQSTKKISSVSSDPNNKISTFVPVPYNMTISLFAVVKNSDDGFQIVEQIIPYFRPEWTVTAESIPEMGLSQDVPIILNSVNPEDIYEDNLAERRVIIWSFNFTMKIWLYGPVSTSGVIKRAITNFYPDTAIGTEKTQTVVIIPGLTANGLPTSNVSASIPYREIASNTNYGYVKTITEYI